MANYFFDWGKKENFPQALEDHAATIINSGAEMVSLGGDHYISYPLLRAHAKKHGPLALVHFDAHRDMDPNAGTCRATKATKVLLLGPGQSR